MKKIATGLASFSLLCLLSAGALADHKDLKEHVTINEKMYVNGTKVKPGRYLVRYNSDSGEVQLERNGKVIAQAKATVVVNNDKFDQDALLTRTTASGTQLTGIRLGGQHEEIQLADISVSTSQDELEDDFNPDMGW
jgi:hypothetical protein